MKTHLRVFETRDELVGVRDRIVKELRSKSKDPENEVKYGDDFISTLTDYYKLRTFRFDFPLADFAGFDSIDLGSMLDKLRMIVSELEKYARFEPKSTPNIPKTPVKTDENEGLDSKYEKDTINESNKA